MDFSGVAAGMAGPPMRNPVSPRNRVSLVASGPDQKSDGAAPAPLQVLDLARHDDAIVVAAEVRHVADRLERVLRKDEDPRLHPLEAAEDLQDVLPVVGHVRGLAVGAHVAELLDDLPALGVHDYDVAL